MATTAFPATAIFDSGATGRDLIQAADQAAAQAAIGIDPSDYGLLDSDNTWTGDNTFTQTLNGVDGDFSGNVTASNGVILNTGRYVGLGYSATKMSFATTSAALQVGTSTIFNAFTTQVQFYKSIVPNNAGAAACGIVEKPWSNVWKNNSFIRGNFTDASNYEYLETTYNSTNNYFQINSAALGTGTVRDIRISRGGDEGIWIDQSGIRFISANSTRFNVQSGEIRMYKYLRSMNSTSTIGTANIPFPAVYSDLFSAADGSVTAPSYSFNSQSTMGIYRAATNQINMVAASGGKGFNLQTNSLSISSDTAFGWRTVPNISQGHSFDTLLARDATGIIAQRNFFQDAPQAFRIYGTWTDSSNGEWLQMDYGVSNTGAATIQAYANGTGANGGLYLRSETSLRLYVGNILAQNISSTVDRFNVHIEPYFDNQKRLGSDVKRFTEVWSYDGNFSNNLTVGSGSSTGRLYLGATNTYIWRNGSTVYEAVNGYTTVQTSMGGSNKLFHFNPIQNQDIDFKVSYDGGVGLFMEGATGNVSFGADVKLYNLGQEGDTNTEALVFSADGSTYDIFSTPTGTGTHRRIDIGGFIGTAFRGIRLDTTNGVIDWQYNNATKFRVDATTCKISSTTTVVNDLKPSATGTYYNGTTSLRWSNVASVDADISGTLTVDQIQNSLGSEGIKFDANYGYLTDANGASNVLRWGSSGFEPYQVFKPRYDETIDFGATSRRWVTGYFVNLDVKTNFSLFNLGETGDTNTESMSMYSTSNVFYMYASATGSGTVRDLKIGSASNNIWFRNSFGAYIFTAGGSGKLEITSSGVILQSDLFPWVDNANLCGKTDKRWSAVNSHKFDAAATWNDAATAFDLITGDVTDTASNAESSLLNLKVGGTSYLRLRKNGDLLFGKQGGSARIVQNSGGIAILGDNGSTVQSFDQYFNYTYKTFRPISDNQHLGYVSRRFLVKANDIFSKGKIRSYNLGDETATDAEYLNLHWLSDHAYLTCENTGTGTARQFTVGTHTNGGIRFNHGTNTVRFSVGGVTATKMYLNSTGLTLYGVLSPQGQKTRDIGTTLARWRELFVGDIDADGTVTANAFVGDGSGLTGLPSGSSTLSGLTDTNVSSPANGQLLIYDAVSSKWDNAALTSTGGTISFTAGAGTLNLEASGGQGPSDRRLKDNIKSIENCLDKVLKMMPVEFTWKDELKDVHLNTGSDIGFIAQDIEEIEPKLVGERKDYKTLQYEKFAPLIVGAIKELYKQIEDLKN
jgi:hypothetical protein